MVSFSLLVIVVVVTVSVSVVVLSHFCGPVGVVGIRSDIVSSATVIGYVVARIVVGNLSTGRQNAIIAL